MTDFTNYEQITVQAADLEARDMWHGKDQITSVDPKDKWTHVVFADGSKKRLLNEETVQVWRESEASKAARYEADRRERLDARIRGWYDRYENRRHTNRIQAKIVERLAAHPGALIDDYLMGELIEAQADDKIEATVHHNISNYLDGSARGDFAEAPDLVAAVEIVANSYRDMALQFRGLSRSTSVMSNVMEDADRAAQAEFARTYDRRWF